MTILTLEQTLSAWKRMQATQHAAVRLARLDGPRMSVAARWAIGRLADGLSLSDLFFCASEVAEPSGSYKWQSRHHASVRACRPGPNRWPVHTTVKTLGQWTRNANRNIRRADVAKAETALEEAQRIADKHNATLAKFAK